MIPITRLSRCASATIASPKTFVYCGGAPAAGGFSSRSGAIASGESDSLHRHRLRRWRAVDDALRLRRVPFLHALEAALLRRGEALALDRVDVDDHGTFGVESLAQGLAQGVHVVAVDHPHIGEVELLEEESGRPVGLDRRLDLRPQPFDPLAEAERQLGQAVLDPLAGMEEAWVEPDPVEVARERADVG